jgi:hypothetical protein
MPYLVNGQLVSEELIKEEFGRIGRDAQWEQITDLSERADRLRAAAEQCAQDRVLIEQTAANDPRPIDPAVLEQEVARESAQRGCRGAFDRDELRRLVERNLRVARVREELTADAAPPSEGEIEAFFTANRHNFNRPVMFHASHIVKYVNHEQSEEQAQEAIEAAWYELERGVPFAEVATRHSDCKDQGGDLGRFPAGQMVEDFEEELRALQPGQRSDIFTTPFGFHIAMLHEVIPAGPAALEEVRDAIERVMTFARRHEAYLRGIVELRAHADIRWVPSESGAGAAMVT